MDTKGTRLGIIDIGSNSIRLVIYELTTDSHRIIDEAKESPRLSERIGADGRLAHSQIMNIVSILSHFKALCEASGATRVKAVATAAIRNASNSLEIVSLLKAHTGLDVQILSGEQEAYLGFLGTANTMDVDKGFLVDIGGGSTELTLFRDREIVNSYSFPFGAVNSTPLCEVGRVQSGEPEGAASNGTKRHGTASVDVELSRRSAHRPGRDHAKLGQNPSAQDEILSSANAQL